LISHLAGSVGIEIPHDCGDAMAQCRASHASTHRAESEHGEFWCCVHDDDLLKMSGRRFRLPSMADYRIGATIYADIQEEEE
jgi:hypothetical protein